MVDIFGLAWRLGGAGIRKGWGLGSPLHPYFLLSFEIQVEKEKVKTKQEKLKEKVKREKKEKVKTKEKEEMARGKAVGKADRSAATRRRLEERQRQQAILEEMRKPTEDMCLPDHQVRGGLSLLNHRGLLGTSHLLACVPKYLCSVSPATA